MTERTMITQDGTSITVTVIEVFEPRNELCDCHRMLGNDFFFLPTGECLRYDRMCNRARYHQAT